MEKGQKRGRGRPPKPAEARKRNNVTIRLRDQTKATLEEKAWTSQRSLSEEIELRLERSLSDQEVASRLDDLQFGRDVVGFLMLAERAMITAGHMAASHGKPGQSWLNDPYAYDRAVKAFLEVAEALRPEGPIPERPGDDWNPWPSFYLAEVAGGTDISQSEWAKVVRDRLGPVAERLGSLRPLKRMETTANRQFVV